MRSKRTISVCTTLAFLLCAFVPFGCAAETASQALVNYTDLLKANPMPPGEKVQGIKIAEDDTETVNLARFAPGVDVKPHLHKTHTETLYVIEGTGVLVMDGKTFEMKPGSIIVIPMNKVHAAKITGSSDCIALQVLTPAMKEPDRVPVP